MSQTTEAGVNLPFVGKYIKTEADKVIDLIMSPAYCMQEKIDGRRLIIAKTTHGVSMYNKRYQSAMAPRWLFEAVAALPDGPWVFDGELTDDGYYIFDITTMPMTDCKTMAFDERQIALRVVMRNWDHPNIHQVQTWLEPDEKFMRLMAVRRGGGEGVIFRPREVSPYFQGQIYKYKFYQTVDAVPLQLRVEGKQAVTVGVLHEGDFVPIGNVKVEDRVQSVLRTFTSVVEIRHRGLSGPVGTGRMIEPVFLRMRDDKQAYGCTSEQLTNGGATDYSALTKQAAATEFLRLVGIDRTKAIQMIKGEMGDQEQD